MVEQTIPAFSDYLFWDVDRSKLDFRINYKYVICRVFELGKLADITEAIHFYGRASIVEALTSANSLKFNAVALSSAIFDLKIEDFKCSNSKPYQANY